MDVRQIDVADVAQLDAAYDVEVASASYDRPYYFPWGREATRVVLQEGDPAIERTLYGAYDGSTMVGVAWLEFPLHDNLTQAWLDVHVHPQHRRRGAGRALLATVLGVAEARDRSVFLGFTALPVGAGEDHPYRRFATSQGFALANTEIHRVLDLPVEEDFLEGLIAEAAPHHEAYDIRHYLGRVPDELLPSLCAVANQLGVDAPTGDIDFEEEKITPEMKLERDAMLEKAGRRRCSTLAVERATGQVVAYTDLMIPADEVPDVINQWGTLVAREHRGHRLGLALKARNLLEVQRLCPERTVVDTGNAATNQWMVSINERLGFRVVEEFAELQRKLG